MKLPIPLTFTLYGRLFTVSLHPGPIEDPEYPEGLYGRFDPGEDHILLNGNLKRDVLEHTYLHELTHAILGEMQREDLSDDERFVDQLAGLLHQALTSGKV